VALLYYIDLVTQRTTSNLVTLSQKMSDVTMREDYGATADSVTAVFYILKSFGCDSTTNTFQDLLNVLPNGDGATESSHQDLIDMVIFSGERERRTRKRAAHRLNLKVLHCYGDCTYSSARCFVIWDGG
jgi:hypothetical protein